MGRGQAKQLREVGDPPDGAFRWNVQHSDSEFPQYLVTFERGKAARIVDRTTPPLAYNKGQLH